MRWLPLLLLALPSVAHGKDLRERVGVGFNNQFSHVSALSVKYGLPAPEPAINIQIEAVGGFEIVDGASDNLFVGLRGLYGLVAEDNMNLYVAGGVGYLARGQVDGVRIQPAFGTEFFFFGLENLGFTAEWGVNIDLGEGSEVNTPTGAPAVGFHYYF